MLIEKVSLVGSSVPLCDFLYFFITFFFNFHKLHNFFFSSCTSDCHVFHRSFWFSPFLFIIFILHHQSLSPLFKLQSSSDFKRYYMWLVNLSFCFLLFFLCFFVFFAYIVSLHPFKVSSVNFLFIDQQINYSLFFFL